jgi:hypothetical protein
LSDDEQLCEAFLGQDVYVKVIYELYKKILIANIGSRI